MAWKRWYQLILQRFVAYPDPSSAIRWQDARGVTVVLASTLVPATGVRVEVQAKVPCTPGAASDPAPNLHAMLILEGFRRLEA